MRLSLSFCMFLETFSTCLGRKKTTHTVITTVIRAMLMFKSRNKYKENRNIKKEMKEINKSKEKCGPTRVYYSNSQSVVS